MSVVTVMSEITLTKEQWDSLEYKHTTVKRAKTYGEIIGLLEEHGIKDYQFTKAQGTDVLAFPLKIKRRDVEQGFIVKMTVPHLMYYVGGKGRNARKTLTYLEDVSWRVFWWYLKSRLSAIKCGISDEVHEFMYNISYALPNGSEIALGDLIMSKADSLSKLAQLEDNSQGRRIIDAEVVVDEPRD